jgi:hypothetical protein
MGCFARNTIQQRLTWNIFNEKVLHLTTEVDIMVFSFFFELTDLYVMSACGRENLHNMFH